MSFGTLALIGVCGLVGPLVSVLTRNAAPVVVGEILAGIVLGRTGFGAIDPTQGTLFFLSQVGFAMLMFSVGMNVPLRDERIYASLGKGAFTAALVIVLAIAGGLLISHIDSVGHPAVYAVLLASGSAAVVLPVVQERGLQSRVVLAVIAQVTVADIAATIAVPFVLAPSEFGRVSAGTALVAGCVFVVYLISDRLRRRPWVHELRRLGKHRQWALDLRMALIVLFALGWVAQRSGASLLIAGFGSGLMVAAIGGPKRLSTEVLGIGGGFFIPLFFVLLGASLDLSGLFASTGLLALAGALAMLNIAIHIIAARFVGQPRAAGQLSCAQLGVPSAIIALGLPEHVISSSQAAAIIAAALISVVVCSIGAAQLRALERIAQRTERLGAMPQQG